MHRLRDKLELVVITVSRIYISYSLAACDNLAYTLSATQLAGCGKSVSDVATATAAL